MKKRPNLSVVLFGALAAFSLVFIAKIDWDIVLAPDWLSFVFLAINLLIVFACLRFVTHMTGAKRHFVFVAISILCLLDYPIGRGGGVGLLFAALAIILLLILQPVYGVSMLMAAPVALRPWLSQLPILILAPAVFGLALSKLMEARKKPTINSEVQF